MKKETLKTKRKLAQKGMKFKLVENMGFTKAACQMGLVKGRNILKKVGFEQTLSETMFKKDNVYVAYAHGSKQWHLQG